MKAWLTARWHAFLGSFDADEASAFSSPYGVLVSGVVLALVFVVVGEVPRLRELSQASATWPCVALALTGSFFTVLAYRFRCRGTWGSISTLVDNGFYAAALSLAALTTRGGFAIGFAVVQALMVVAFPASFYGFSLLMALVLCVPTLLLLSWHVPDVSVTLVLLASCVMAVAMMVNRSKQRQLLAGAKRLELALGATDQVLDMAMQRALTTTLLGLGNFLHELKNTQAAVRMSLELLEREKLEGDQRESLDDALQAARSQQALLDDTLEALRRQAQPREGTLLVVGDVLERTLQGRQSGLTIEYRERAPHFEVLGEPTHLATVLRNLLRNARQAGATRVEVGAVLDRSNGSIVISVEDDGPGIVAEQAVRLFQPFVSAGKPTGTGLGLYLCRRYVELMNGEIRVDPTNGKGARFTIRLPGKLLALQTSETLSLQTAAKAS